jgi:osmotically inducible lipoprotein OsmB
MNKLLLASVVALSVGGCAMSERETNGALIGGATGAVVGGVATHSWGGAAVGGVVGGVVGATIANATAPHRNCRYNSYGHRVCHRY